MARLTHLFQRTNNSCGQTCVAMLAGTTVAQATRAVGVRGATLTQDIVRGLHALGLRCPPRLVPVRHVRGLVPLALVKLAPPRGRGWHWVVWEEGDYLDPLVGRLPADMAAMDFAQRGLRVTSLLPVTREGAP